MANWDFGNEDDIYARYARHRQDMAEYLLESCHIEQPWNFEILTNVDNYATKAGHLTALR